MRKIVLLVALISELWANSEFVQLCENPTPSQKVTLEALIKSFNGSKAKYEKKLCKPLEKVLYKSNFIRMRRKNITDLSPIKYFTHIKKLTIPNNHIKDISAIKNMKQLKELNIRNNPIKDFSIVSNLINLEDLSLSSKKEIPNIFKSLSKLKYLSLKVTDFDLDYIKHLTHLKSLSFNYSSLKNICSLNHLISLKSLSITNSNLSSIQCLNQLENLKELRLSSNQIEDISVVKNFQKLTTLKFPSNPISDISVLKEVPSLQYISVDSTKVDDISVLASLPNLKSVYLGINEMKNCSPKNIHELKTGKTCLEADGTLKPFWKRWLGL